MVPSAMETGRMAADLASRRAEHAESLIAVLREQMDQIEARNRVIITFSRNFGF